MTETHCRVVIADDSPDDRRELRRLLLSGSDARFEFVECDLASDVLRLVMESPTPKPDCVLLDFYLPDMDAAALLPALLSADGLTACPILVITGRADSNFGRQLLRLGAQDFIGKEGLTAPILVRAVENAMERWSMASELRASRRALETRERQLLSLANNAPDILVRFDRSYRHVFVNTAATKATGLAAAEFLGRTNRDLGMPEALCDRWESAIARVFDTGTPEEIEFSFDGPAGLAHYRLRLVPEYDQHDWIELVLGVSRDVTEERQAELTERESAQRLQMALTAARARPWSWDIRSDAVDGSPEKLPLHGRSAAHDSPLYRDWIDAIHPDDRADVETALRDALSRTVPQFRAEFRVQGTTDDPCWVLGIGQVELDAAGEAVRMVGINLDIHERKRIELALLIEDRRKDEFLATLSHELRNPLAPLTNAIELLKLGPPGAGVTESTLAIMERQVRHLTQLVDDLMDVSRIRNGKIALKVTDVSIGDVVRQAIEACQPLITQAKHRLTVLVEPAHIRVRGDEVRLTQVLTNLLNNAAKYTSNSGHIDLQARIDDGQVVLRVVDDGAGIPRDMLADVFELFTQVETTRDRSGGGLGIGLSLVQKVVELHGGTVRCESRGLGLGTAFEIRLPQLIEVATDVRDVAAPTPLTGLRAGEGSAPGDAARRVLLIDDNVDGADTMATILRLHGYEVWTEHDGGAGLATALAIRPAIMVVDIGLPTIDGYEVARRVRTEPGMHDVFLIALTGWGSTRDQDLARQAGFDVHLTKPVDLTALERLLAAPREVQA